jgi:hypothetical protein
MEFEDLMRKNITRDTAEKLLEGFNARPPEAVDRILTIDIDRLTPRSGDDWVAALPEVLLGMLRDKLQEIIDG